LFPRYRQAELVRFRDSWDDEQALTQTPGAASEGPRARAATPRMAVGSAEQEEAGGLLSGGRVQRTGAAARRAMGIRGRD